MGEYMDQVPASIREHLREITASSGLSPGDESEELIAQGWLEKKGHFEDQIGKMSMDEVDRVDEDDEHGFLVMTYSGSLLNVGPLADGGRHAEYTSIGLRQDVPQTADKDDSRLDGAVEVDDMVTFAVGPIRSSSPVFKIAVFSDPMDVGEEEKQLAMATEVLAEEFVDVNKTLMLE